MYLTEFKSIDDVLAAYQAPEGALNDAEVLLAWYGYGDYEGSSLVLFRKGGNLFEVNGSHCSCYGLEGQWEPEQTTWEALSIRNLGGYDGSQDATEALARIIKENSKCI